MFDYFLYEILEIYIDTGISESLAAVRVIEDAEYGEHLPLDGEEPVVLLYRRHQKFVAGSLQTIDISIQIHLVIRGAAHYIEEITGVVDEGEGKDIRIDPIGEFDEIIDLDRPVEIPDIVQVIIF